VEKRIIVGAVVAIVVVGIIAAVLILSGGKEKPVTPGYERYSKFGFSFEYPEGMTLSEEGALTTSATDYAGIVTGELGHGDNFEVFSVVWLAMTPAPDNLEEDMETFFKRAHNNDNAVKGKMVETTKAGHRMIRFNYTFTIPVEGIEGYGTDGAWYCDIDNKFYILSLSFTTTKALDPTPIFLRYLDSFVCH
jgi:hypothetical protein